MEPLDLQHRQLCLINQAILGYANPVVKDWGIKALKKAELKEFLLKSFL